MDIGIVTICYNGYGKFAKKWAESMSQLSRNITIVAMGKDHGITDIPDWVNVIYSDKVTMGVARNIGVRATNAEWILYFSIDDLLKENIVYEVKQGVRCADACFLGLEIHKDGKVTDYEITLPSVSSINRWAHKFIVPGYLIYRKSIWEQIPYVDTDYPNLPFIFQQLHNGVRFSKTKTVCAEYIRWEKSHSGLRDKKSIEDVTNYINQYV